MKTKETSIQELNDLLKITHHYHSHRGLMTSRVPAQVAKSFGSNTAFVCEFYEDDLILSRIYRVNTFNHSRTKEFIFQPGSLMVEMSSSSISDHRLNSETFKKLISLLFELSEGKVYSKCIYIRGTRYYPEDKFLITEDKVLESELG